MSLVKAIFATTHRDSQGERLSKEALEDLVTQSKSRYIKVTPEHDPRTLPIGRVVDSRLVELEDGNYAIESTYELFDGKDPQPDDPNRDLEVMLPDDDRVLTVSYDYSYRRHLEKLEELNTSIRFHSDLQYYGKKAVEPLSILALGGVYILGKIVDGFLQKVGEETFSLLKRRLSEVLALQGDKKERILEFDLVLKTREGIRSVRLFLTNPTEKQIGLVLEKGLGRLDQEIGKYFAPGVKEVCINLRNTKFEVTYLMNGKAKPIIPKEDFRMIDLEA